MSSRALALYTTIYPGAEKFLPAWYRSICGQTDRGFDLWIGADQIAPSAVFDAVGAGFPAHWVAAAPVCSTPAAVRRAGIDAILASENGYEAVVFVDCDDVMLATRVASARTQLRTSDVAGCAMEIVKDDTQPTGLYFRLPPRAIPGLLAKTNAFGMSNTAYRAEVLREIPPSPPQWRLMDWFRATACWIRDARLSFDNTPGMMYRQYAE